MLNDTLMNYKTAKAKHPLLYKWWMRVKKLSNRQLIDENGKVWQTGAKFYVPWWAWPFELIHRMIFGYVKLEKI